MKIRLLLAALLCFAMSPAWSASCFISEYATMARDADSNDIPVASTTLTTQIVSYTTTTQSAAFTATVRYIRVVCDAKAHFVIGANPTATSSSPYVPADTPEYFGVTNVVKIAFYDGSS